MPATRYKIIAIGPQVAATATAPVIVNIAGVGKKALPGQPFIVANELVCSAIARLLLLPCPPGALMQKNGDTYFFSLDFNIAGQSLPPISAPDVVAKFPRLCWGIIVFDALVMNGDRHPGNIAFDMTTNQIQIFDHSHAFLTPNGAIEHNLTARENSPAIGGHCLASEINTDDGMEDWLARVKLIPDYFIEGAVRAGCECGIPSDKEKFISDFMKKRRDNLETLVKSNLNSFPKLPNPPPAQPPQQPAAQQQIPQQQKPPQVKL